MTKMALSPASASAKFRPKVHRHPPRVHARSIGTSGPHSDFAGLGRVWSARRLHACGAASRRPDGHEKGPQAGETLSAIAVPAEPCRAGPCPATPHLAKPGTNVRAVSLVASIRHPHKPCFHFPFNGISMLRDDPQSRQAGVQSDRELDACQHLITGRHANRLKNMPPACGAVWSDGGCLRSESSPPGETLRQRCLATRRRVHARQRGL